MDVLQKYDVLGFSRIFRIILLKKKDRENTYLKTQDLTAKFHGLLNYGMNFLKKMSWNRFMGRRPGPWRLAHRSTTLSLNDDRWRQDRRPRFNY
jgi:hypothetical protein